MRRRLMLAMPLALAGCGLSERPYEERRQWPLLVPRPASLPAARGGRVLEVRTFREGPGMNLRGLQSLRANGSLDVAFYEEWSVSPAIGVEEALRAWLAASGKFAAVVPPGSRLVADVALEGELGALLTDEQAGVGRATLGVVVLDVRASPVRPVLQRRITGEARLAGKGPEASMRAQVAALAEAFGQIEASLSV
jgi:hypothetical protein